jgi:Sulfotransferase family
MNATGKIAAFGTCEADNNSVISHLIALSMQYFFILGCPRSGTTMLQMALNRHSLIAIPPETKYFSSFMGHSGWCQRRHLKRINDDLQIDVVFPQRPLVEPRQQRAFFEHVAESFLRTTGRNAIAFLGEKSPAHSGFMPQIMRVFPEAKFLWVFRDGRDVALSLTQVPWMPKNLYAGFLLWLFYYSRLAQAKKTSNVQIHFVKYEDFVSDPIRELSRISDFLGVDFEPAMAASLLGRDEAAGRVEPIAATFGPGHFDVAAGWQQHPLPGRGPLRAVPVGSRVVRHGRSQRPKPGPAKGGLFIFSTRSKLKLFRGPRFSPSTK